MLRFCGRLLKPKNIRFYCTNIENTQNVENAIPKGGFAKSFEDQQKILNPEPLPNATFASLLRNSKFIDLGDPEGKIVKGDIIHVVDDDLYIDFGWKFYCVCPRPQKNADQYVRGTKVRLMIKDLELSTRFLGSETDLTLLEADCKLLNIIYSPAKR